MRIGIFGGSFDPVHLGHLLLAESCQEQAKLDKILFIPNSVSPFKQTLQHAPNQNRLEMLQLAISGHAAFEIDTSELDRGGISYTVETLEHLKQKHPQDELFLLMGADSLAEFAHWKNPQRICELAEIVVVHRAGSADPDWNVLAPFMSADQFAATKELHVEMPPIGLSSREIRARVASEKTIRYRVPRAVEVYIEQHKLYR
jgi:nicotinate-nucleotide adenylyltransferase